MTVIYLDSLFLLNFVINYLLLLSSARLAAEEIRRPRLALAALLGACYAAAVCFPRFAFLLHPLCKIGLGILMLLLSFPKSRRFLRLSLLFFGISFAFGGAIFALSFLGSRSLALQNGIVYCGLDLKGVLLSAALCYVLITMVFERIGKHSAQKGELVPVVLYSGEKRIALRALLDTGNTLADPVTNRQVILAEGRCLQPLLDGGPLLDEAALRDPVGTMERFHASGYSVRFRLLPYQAVGVSCGMLLAVKADRAVIGGAEYRNLLVALSPTNLSDGGAYNALVGPPDGYGARIRPSSPIPAGRT